MVSVNSNSGWLVFERLQNSIQKNSKINAAAFADEQALTDLLDDFTHDEPSAPQVERRFRSLRRNRRRNHFKRCGLLNAHSAEAALTEASDCPEDAGKKAEQDDLYRFIELKVRPSEWIVLRKLSQGDSYEAVAGELGVSAGKLRTQICRVRESIRAVA